VASSIAAASWRVVSPRSILASSYSRCGSSRKSIVVTVRLPRRVFRMAQLWRAKMDRVSRYARFWPTFFCSNDLWRSILSARIGLFYPIRAFSGHFRSIIDITYP
jgi:hypothetical protein